MTPPLSFQLPATLLLAAALASCGGGSGGGPATTPTPLPPATPATPCDIRIVADQKAETGKTAGATVLACSALMADITWTQTGGAALTLLAAHSATVAFETPVAGSVTLRADVRFIDGRTASSSTEIEVAARSASSFISVRADHSVRPATDTSVRAWPVLAAGDSVSSIAWTQVAGPSVTMDTIDNHLLMFKAPQVDADTVLRFRATLTTSAGRVDYDEVTVGVERQPAAPKEALFDVAARVHPYRQAGVYAAQLVRCVYDIDLYYDDSTHNSLCSAGTLPLIQAETVPGGMPTVAQVMGRVLVSHDFLGANFEQFLLTEDPHGDFRRLLAGTSAIVIGSHVRPSFYTAGTGAIYLDADHFWLTPEQRDVVSEVPDYRLAFDDGLNYSSFGRQIKNNDYARRSYPDRERLVRSMDELIFSLGKLLYHELGHAGDFFAPSERALDPAKSIWDNVSGRVASRTLPSDLLADQYPLASLEMKGLGQVLFMGATPTAEQIAYRAVDVGNFFAADRASDDYAYAISGDASSREDLAMLFEEFMMSYRHAVQYDIAFANKYFDGMTGAQAIVGWGQRGRVAQEAIKPRIKLVLQRIAPWIDPAAVDTLPAPILMKSGASWDANLVQDSATAQFSRSRRQLGPGEGAKRVRDDLKDKRSYR